MIETPPRHARPWLPAALSAALAMLLYAHTLGGTWIYDDLFHARDDPRLADVRLWGQYLTDSYMPSGVDRLWRPLVSLSYAVQWKLTGDRAWPFHAVNILLHAGASALVAELARRLTGKRSVALVAGLFFAAHPLHVEGVAYIVGRAESACAVGSLGALVLLMRPLTVRRVMAVYACFLVALLSKEQGLLLPAMMLALWPLRRRLIEPMLSEASTRRGLVLIVLFTLAGYIVYREHILPWYWDASLLDYATQPMTHSGLRDRVLIPFALLGRAVALLVLPLKLSPEYGLAVITARQDLADIYLYLGILSSIAVLGGAWIAYRRRAWTMLFLLFCAALTYFMVANVKLIGVVFAERLLYLPSAFVLILLAMALSRLPRRAMAVVVAVIVMGWSVRTVTYAARWNDLMTFYARSIEDSPRAARLRVLLARQLIDRGELAPARRIIEEGLTVAPDYWKLWSLAARVAIEQGRLSDAQSYIDRAWTLNPQILELLAVEERLQARRAATRPATQPG
ncbi:MAG: Tetratricopeptide 2 repeat protein [Phycisphaerales bacterium]|nr:Tetratricopeptide 2 repeat protein [Phycisphaerales bacterium]